MFIIGSFIYVASNKANGVVGRIMQIYLLAWIIWSVYYITNNVAGIIQSEYLYQTAFFLLLFIVLPYFPIYVFWLYEKVIGIKKRELRRQNAYGSVNATYKFSTPLELGIENSLQFQVNNPTDLKIKNTWVRVIFPDSVKCTSSQVSFGTLDPMSSTTINLPFIPLSTDLSHFGYFDLYFELEKRSFTKSQLSLGKHVVVCSHFLIDSVIHDQLKFGFDSSITINLENRFPYPLTDFHVICSFQKGIDPSSEHFKMDVFDPGSFKPFNFTILPKSTGITEIGYFNIGFLLNGNQCYIGPVEFLRSELIVPDLKIRLNLPDYFYKDILATIGIVSENTSDDALLNVCFSSCFPSFLDCKLPTACVSDIAPGESRYASIDLKPNVSGKVNFGNLNISFEVNGITCQKDPIYLGTHNVV